jgi:hypothetical protein
MEGMAHFLDVLIWRANLAATLCMLRVLFKTCGACMRRSLAIALLSLLVAPFAAAESHNPADYPLRVALFRRQETNFYHGRDMESAKGEGRGNLFESGNPKGLDFQFECDQKLQTSSGFETFPAKWKKPGAELVILQPQFGKSGYNTCTLKVMVKDFVYVPRNGNLVTQAPAGYKQWMVAHQYDPEQGKNTPVRGTEEAPAAKPATAQAPATAPPQ